MVENVSVSFRPRSQYEEDFIALVDWCEAHDYTFGSFLNSLLPALAYAVQNQVIEDPETGALYLRADFGDIKLLRTQYKTPRALTNNSKRLPNKSR